MRVLGIDPGIATTGYGVVESKDNHFILITSGSITTSIRFPFPERLRKIFLQVRELIEKYRPEAVAVEEVFLSQNPQLALRMGQAMGAAILAGAVAGVKVLNYTALEVKQAVVGYGRADKIQVQEMIKRLLNLKDRPLPEHAADALGIAITCINTVDGEERWRGNDRVHKR